MDDALFTLRELIKEHLYSGAPSQFRGDQYPWIPVENEPDIFSDGDGNYTVTIAEPSAESGQLQRTFKSEEEAKHWGRTQVDLQQRRKFARVK